MSEAADISRTGSRRVAPGVINCPSCGGPLKPDSNWCPTCHFTGSKTMELFPHDPPPLLPVLDVVGAFKDSDLAKIGTAREKLRRRFPQFQWRICLVHLPEDTNLPVFGFWLLNACPFAEKETLEDRAWTILLLINAATGKAAIIPGYAAEPYLSNDDWRTAMAAMAEPWKSGKPTEAVVRFFETSQLLLKNAWKRYGSRKSN